MRLKTLGALTASLVMLVGPATVNAEPLSFDALSQDRTGGTYLDDAGERVVTVLNEVDASRVRGAVTKVVRHSTEQLTAVKEKLDAIGTTTRLASDDKAAAGWGIDPKLNKVVVDFFANTPANIRQEISEAAKQFGDAVNIREHDTKLSLLIYGGDQIENGNTYCSAGFNALRNGSPVVLSAGHCEALGGRTGYWDVGRTLSYTYPDSDMMILQNDSGYGPSAVNDGTRITQFADPTVGQRITRSGRTSGIHSGQVSQLDYTFRAEGATVYHEWCAYVHAEGGDSGGPGYAGNKGYGTLTGGDGSFTCFYPATREAKAYGLTLPGY